MRRDKISAEGQKRKARKDVLAEGKHSGLGHDNTAAMQQWRRSQRGEKHRPAGEKRGGGAQEEQRLKFRRGLGVQWVRLCFAQRLAHLQHPSWCDLGHTDLGAPLSDFSLKSTFCSLVLD